MLILSSTYGPLFPSKKCRSAQVHSNRFLRDDTLRDEDVNQPLQRFHVLLWQKIVVHRNRHKMHKAAVELEMAVDVPEGIVPMVVV